MTISSDIAALQGVLNQFKGSGITNYGGAVQALQVAGNAAIGSIGPAIDNLSGGDPGTMKITQWAWSKNGELAGVTSDDSATQSDLDTATAAVTFIIAQYNQANRLATSLKVAPAKAAAPQVSYSPPVAARAPPVFTAPPGATPAAGALAAAPKVGAPAVASKLGPVTGIEIAAGGAGGLVGLAIGARVAGIVLGGPLGLVAGAAAGFMLTKAFKV